VALAEGRRLMSAASQVPPQNIEAEESVLGAMLVVDQVAGAVKAEVGLQAEDFYFDKHGLLYGAITRLAGEGKPTDEIAVSEVLGADLEKAGGRHYISELAAKVPSAANWHHYATIVREKALWRSRMAAGSQMQEAAAAEDAELFARASLLSDEGAHRNSHFSIERQNDLLFELMEGRSKAEFFWPFPKLNRLQKGGMRRGQLIVVSGYTNEGKSNFGGQLLDVNRKHGSVCLYDNEMSPEEQASRRANRITGIPDDKIANGELDAEQRKKLMRYMNNEDLHWPIEDIAGWTVDEVALHIRMKRWDFVVIDILHNFPFDDERQIAAAVARLKQAARLANCVIVLMAHVNRGGTKPDGFRRRPVRSDLKWSGEIENLADAVVFVYRLQDQETFEPIDAGAIYFDKCRGGKLGGVSVRFNPAYLSFELAPDQDPEDRPLAAAPAGGPGW
jgi:replicative DNA helicase